MLTTNRARTHDRRGIILVLILGMLGLLAFLGVTFATISGQARIGARNYAQSVMRPQPSDLMEFALSQLIGDTSDVRSAIRGHSMARDMYGNDAFNNGYIDQTSPYAADLYFSSATPVPLPPPPPPPPLLPPGGTIKCVTGIPVVNDPFYGYNFTRWVVRFGSDFIPNPNDATQEIRFVGQTFEIVYDDATGATDNGTQRIFYLAPPPDTMNFRNFQSPEAHTAGSVVTQSILLGEAAGGVPLSPYTFTLDGRHLRGFNGPGMGPLAQFANMRYNGGVLGGLVDPNTDIPVGAGDPNVVGMDEDYDACDLENWFLAIQSADGQAIVPSFHRPGILQALDWQNSPAPPLPAGYPYQAQSRSRILRPRAIDGNDRLSFPDLIPNLTTNKITYDVDNDADGTTDSVWVDLGYPPLHDPRGVMYKPLFAFMVVGLNGRIPLNTAGNLALRDATTGKHLSMHASHLGNSPSEVDPTFGLQNAPGSPPLPAYQLDNATDSMGNAANISVNVTQLRNILTGARPYVPDPYTLNPSSVDNNLVPLASGAFYYLPNNVPDGSDNLSGGYDYLPSRAVAGRWGEPGSIRSAFDRTPNTNAPPPLYLPTYTPMLEFSNLVRAGLSMVGNGLPGAQVLDGRDVNNTTFDGWPTTITDPPQPPAPTPPVFLGPEAAGPSSTMPLPNGYVWPADYYDAAGDTAHFAERARRFVTPIDLTGEGRLGQYASPTSKGYDNRGRVAYQYYFRPTGVPVATETNATPKPEYPPYTGGTPSQYDVTNNLFHGFESHRNPSMTAVTTAEGALLYAATPTQDYADGNPTNSQPAPYNATYLPASGGKWSPGNSTFNPNTNSLQHNAGLNEANETALYPADQSPYPSNSSDQIFGFQDLEWLYRAHDEDGSSLYSRLSELAPLSFRDASDALRRRRLYSIDVWDSNAFSWTNDNPSNMNYSATPALNNSRFEWPFVQQVVNGPYHVFGLNPVDQPPPNPPPLYVPPDPRANASLNALTYSPATSAPPWQQAGPGWVPFVNAPTVDKIQSSAPSLAHRDRKINLNFPLPVSNETNEPTRQKWIKESYQFLKTVLPPLSIDEPEELALLSQYLVNIIDFRDPDATMTTFKNPDVFIRTGNAGAAPSLAFKSVTTFDPTQDVPLIQYGMEYNPVAINEVLAYSFQRKQNAAGAQTGVGRFYIELVNTLTDAGPDPMVGLNVSKLNLGGLSTAPPTEPYVGGCWDLIFTDDAPNTRPDPYTGQLLPLGVAGPGYYAPIPLNGESFNPGGQDVVLTPLSKSQTTFPTGPPNYFYTIGNPVVVNAESNPFSPTQTLNPSFDPISQATPPGNPTLTIPKGVLYKTLTPTPTWVTDYPGRLPIQSAFHTNKYKWVCLRRPVNPFRPVTADDPDPNVPDNPMVVVDAMRFRIIEGTGDLTSMDDQMHSVPTPGTGNGVYSVQRMQPYRGGHLVPQPLADNVIPGKKLDVTRYGFSEQIGVQTVAGPTNYGIYRHTSQDWNATQSLGYHSLGANSTPNDSRWDRFVFNDRDFTSPAELMLVPGCPPGLFTKLFVDAEPTAGNKALYFNLVADPTDPPSMTTRPTLGASLATDSPHTYPYLVDHLFYSSASPQWNGNPTDWDPVVGPSSGGWYKMFEFFEVPSPVLGALGTVAQGENYDWFRQDVRPGQINPNLIMDEEVFLGLVGNAGDNTVPPAAPADHNQVVITVPTRLNNSLTTSAFIPQIVTQVGPTGAVLNSYPISQFAGFYDSSIGSSAIKVCFSDFLKIRHGSSGNMFFGSRYAISQSNAPVGLTEAPFRSLTYPDIDFTLMRPAFPTANQLLADHGKTHQDAGVKNQLILDRSAPPSAANPYYPPAIPPRRLFSLTDTKNTSNAYVLPTDSVTPTQELGYTPPPVPLLEAVSGGTHVVDLASMTNLLADSEQHPYNRSEWMQKMMNLSTVRTHQYAVWITVGFFEVTKVGDPSVVATTPDMANLLYDQIGREIGMLNGKNSRHRGFFIVDRLKLDGFDPNNPGKYKEAVLYRKIIQ